MTSTLLPADSSRPCIEWPGARSPEGYGRIGWHGYAHRQAWEEATGEPIPKGLQVDYLCRNRACVNTDHLEVVTQAENLRRGESPWAVNARKTHCIRDHEFTPENTIIHGGHRECRTCTNIHHKEYRDRKKRERGG